MKTRRIRTKIIILSCLICICSIASATMISYKILSQNIRKQTFGKLEEVSMKHAVEIDGWLEIQSRLINEVYDEIIYRDDFNRNSLIDYLDYKNERNTDIIEYYIALPENAFILDVGMWYPEGDYNTVEREWYINALETEGIAISSPYVDVNHGEVIVTLSKAIMDNGKIIGVLGSDISINHIIEIINESRTSFEGYGFLIDDNGNVLAHPNKEFLYSKGRGITNINDVLNEEDMKIKYIDEKELKSIIDYDGVEKYLIYTKLGFTDWEIGLATPVEVVMSPLNKVVNQSIILGIVLTIISVGLTILLGNSISKPISVATNYIEEMASLDITRDIDPKYLKMEDEIGRMFNSFQMIVESLRGFLIELSNLSNRISTFSDELAITSQKSNYYTNEVGESLSNISEGNHGKLNEVSNLIVDIENLSKEISKFTDDDNIIKDESLTKRFSFILDATKKLSNEFNKIQKMEQFGSHQIMAITELTEDQIVLMEEISSASQCLAELGEELNIYIGKFKT